MNTSLTLLDGEIEEDMEFINVWVEQYFTNSEISNAKVPRKAQKPKDMSR